MIKTVIVDKTHIKNGVKRNLERCPIALAINDILPSGYFCKISSQWCHIYVTEAITSSIKDMFPRRTYLPFIARDFVRRFDKWRWRRVQPITFEIDII